MVSLIANSYSYVYINVYVAIVQGRSILFMPAHTVTVAKNKASYRALVYVLLYKFIQ